MFRFNPQKHARLCSLRIRVRGPREKWYSQGEIGNRFDATVTVLTKVLGTSSRVLVHRTVVEMFRQYSQRADFSYQDSLRDRLIVLKEAVVANHLIPKGRHDGIDFDSVENTRLTSPRETGNHDGSYDDLDAAKKSVHAP